MATVIEAFRVYGLGFRPRGLTSNLAWRLRGPRSSQVGYSYGEKGFAVWLAGLLSRYTKLP